MKNKIKKTVSVLLTLVMVFTLLPAAVLAEEMPGTVASGYCGMSEDGANVIWSLDDTWTLTISGTGDMTFFAYAGDEEMLAPWYGYREKILRAVVEDGVTKIGEGAFASLKKLEDISLPDSVIKIGDGAFWHCESLREITLPRNLKYIGFYAFQYCISLTSVTIPASASDLEASLFTGCTSLERAYILCPETTYELADFVPAETVIYGYIGSTAETYAQRSGNPFVALCPVDYTHTVIEAEAVAATCTGAGHSAGWYCTVCGVYLNGNGIDPLNHPNRTGVAATEATAAAHGYTAGVYCPDCDTWLSGHEVIHNHLGEQTVIQEPTETEPGLVEIVCTVCGQAIRYSAAWEPPAPAPQETPGGIQGFWMRIVDSIRGFIDWFLWLFHKP